MNIHEHQAKEILREYGAPTSNGIVIFDTKNIQEKLNSNVFPRLRIGVGNDFSKGKQVDYVLGDWSAEELVVIEDKIETIKEMILGFCFNGLNNTMNTYNNK